MKKKLLVLCLCLILTSGCGKQIPKLKNGKEAVVTFKGNKKISVDDLYEKVKSDFALQALVTMIDKQILEDKYKNKIKDATTYAESTIKSLEDNYGEDLQKMIAQYTSYQTVDAYKESLYISNLQNEAIDDYAKKQVTDKEIKKYYDDEMVGDVEVSHILITADVKDDMSEEDKTAAEKDAKTKAEELIKQLKDAKDVKATFESLAKENSKDEATASNGGSLGYINYGTLSEDYDSIIEQAIKLKNGTIYTKPIKTTLGYHIILRTNQKEKQKLEDAKETIVKKLADEKKENDQTIQVKAMQELRKEYDIEIQDTELKEQYARYIQNSLQQTNEQ